MVSRLGTETSPSSGASSATIMRKSVVFPAPFGPTRPTLSPGLSWKEASTKRSCRPYCLCTRDKEIIHEGGPDGPPLRLLEGIRNCAAQLRVIGCDLARKEREHPAVLVDHVLCEVPGG